MTLLLLFVAAGTALTLGIVLAVLGWLGTTAPRRPPASTGPSARLARWWTGGGNTRTRTVHRAQLLAALAGGIGGWLFTGLILMMLLAPGVVFGIPWLFNSTRPSTVRIERLEALAEWTQRLADVLLLGTGLEQALITSRSTAPAVIDREVGDLVSRLQARWRPSDALRAFGNELGDATSDKVVAALVLRVEDRGPGLAGALSDLAESVRDEVRQRRTIEADRAKHRATVRWLAVITLSVASVGSLNRTYTRPYTTPLGEAFLLFLAIAFVGVIAWMRNLASQTPVPRLLEPDRRSKTGRTAATEPVGTSSDADPDPDPDPATATGADPHAGPHATRGATP